MPETDCLMCDTREKLTDDKIVYRDATWTAASAIPVPGWILLFLNEHKEGAWELTEAEGEQLGRLTVMLTRSLRQVCQPERVYVMSAGETALHFHVMVMARGAQVPEEWRGGALINHSADLADAEEAEWVLKSVRAVLAGSTN